MNTRTIRRTPWTCRFGRSGVTIEQLGLEESRVDDVFWACRRPEMTAIKVIGSRDCADCPFWEMSPRFEQTH